MITVQMLLPMLAAMTGIGDDYALCIEAGCRVLGAMMEHDRTARCGPKWKPGEIREAERAR